MTRRLLLVCLIGLFLLISSNCFAYIVIAKEKSQVLYGRGKIEQDKGEFEVHYDVDEENEVIYRKEVNNFRTGENIEDNTVYNIVDSEIDTVTGQRVIKAVGKPAPFALELLVIGEGFVLSCRSTSDYFRITDMERREVKKLNE